MICPNCQRAQMKEMGQTRVDGVASRHFECLACYERHVLVIVSVSRRIGEVAEEARRCS